MGTMSESQGPVAGLSEHELSEIRMLIEERTGICFDESRERFFSTRVREHLRAKQFAHGTDLLRAMRKANVEYEALLERLLTQETSFFRYPAVYETFEKRVLPELHVKKFWKNPRTLRVWSAGCSTGEEPYSIAITIAGIGRRSKPALNPIANSSTLMLTPSATAPNAPRRVSESSRSSSSFSTRSMYMPSERMRTAAT